MADITDGIGLRSGPDTPHVISVTDAKERGVNRVLLDFAKIVQARSDDDLTALTTNDVLKIMLIPANYAVVGLAVRVDTAEGSALTVDVGWDGDADGWLNDLNLNATGLTASTDIHQLFTSENNVQLTFSAAPTTAVLEVFAFLTKLDRGL